MNFFPTDPTKYRPAKIIFQVDLLNELDRAIQEELGGYKNRHELVNDLIEQGLIDLRFPEEGKPVPPKAKSEGETRPETQAAPKENGHEQAAPKTQMPEVQPLSSLAETRIEAPARAGEVVQNELAVAPEEPLFGMHNRDAPSAWALAMLGRLASAGPIDLGDFYEQATNEAWRLAAQLEAFEAPGVQKLAVMLPRNPEKPQSAGIGFQAFALGQIGRRADGSGKLAASGPFYQWGAVGVTGDVDEPRIGLTDSGWELLDVFDGLDFSLPHDETIAIGFLEHLAKYGPADLWGFRTALDGAIQGFGRTAMNEYFAKRLDADYGEVEWKGTVAESVASGYVSRARAWGLVEPKMVDRKYAATPAGERAAEQLRRSPQRSRARR